MGGGDKGTDEYAVGSGLIGVSGPQKTQIFVHLCKSKFGHVCRNQNRKRVNKFSTTMLPTRDGQRITRRAGEAERRASEENFHNFPGAARLVVQS